MLGRPLGQIGYQVHHPVRVFKTVDYYAAHTVDGSSRPTTRSTTCAGSRRAEAATALSYQHDRKVLRWFADDPVPEVTVLLVRHAKAGKREDWDGEDDLRPLTKGGRKQAALLRGLLPLFGADRVHSAPLVRCVATVRGVAADLSVPVVDEPLLSEDGYWVDEEAGVRRFLAITAAGGTPVVSSQGGVIPDVVSRLADESGLRLPSIASKKASLWVLSFTVDATGSPRLFAGGLPGRTRLPAATTLIQGTERGSGPSDGPEPLSCSTTTSCG